MKIDISPPPSELVPDFGSLEAIIAADSSGSTTRRLIDYFNRSALLAQQVQLRSTSFEEREFAEAFVDALSASGRVAARAWSKRHGRDIDA